ncbi:uncharacterized protein LOC143182094 isoform X5 [Calliopsis andreniformis]|uniref:uncharacterized protein LOC143182094 isoform X5 n=1 Tax=Calliopsis andreniformis TaxID=337506 RepID=UPI003FCCD5D0
MSSLDYLDLCRLCLVKDRVSVPIFEGEGDVRQIFLKIAACLPVKVAREDKLPKKICDDCVYKVELFYQFWNTTVNAEKQLLQWLGEVGMDGKQGYVTNTLNQNVMKQEQSTENRLDGSVMQQVSEHQNNMNMGMMDNMGLGIPMMISSANQQQITSVPMDTSGSSVQTVQAVPGPSSQTTHNQISQNQTNSTTQQEEEEESSEDEENSDDECDGDEGLPVKEESEEDPNSRTIEPTTFVNVSLACDEAGPSGLQQQKISDMSEIPMQQPADADPKSGKELIAVQRRPTGEKVIFRYVILKKSQNQRQLQNTTRPFKSQVTVCIQQNGINEQMKTGSKIVTVSNVQLQNTPRLFQKKVILRPQQDGVNQQIKTGSKIIRVSSFQLQNTSRPLQKQVTIRPQQDGVNQQIKTATETTTKIQESVKPEGVTATQVQGPPIPEAIAASKAQKSAKPEIVTATMVQESSKLNANRTTQIQGLSKPEAATATKIQESAKSEADQAEVDLLEEVRTTCPFCGKRLTSVERLEYHVMCVHRQPHQCDKCKKAFQTEQALEDHKVIHRPDYFFKCEVCHVKYKSEGTMKRHVLRVHTLKESKYICEHCGRGYKLKIDLTQHIKRNHCMEDQVCRFCGKVVKDVKSHEWRHQRQLREDRRQFACHMCDKKFCHNSRLDKHLRLHEKGFKCDECGKEFRGTKELTSHKHGTHGRGKTWTCEVCQKVQCYRPARSNFSPSKGRR